MQRYGVRLKKLPTNNELVNILRAIDEMLSQHPGSQRISSFVAIYDCVVVETTTEGAEALASLSEVKEITQ